MVLQNFIEQTYGLEVEAEYRFHPKRRWRADYAIPSLKIAIEIDGGIWIYGRHNHAASMIKDMEKGNNYSSLGWLVFHFTVQNAMNADNLELLDKAIKYRLTTSKNK